VSLGHRSHRSSADMMACWANISFSEVQFPLLEIEREPGSGPQVLKAAAQPVS
jgi:hypothetical protein